MASMFDSARDGAMGVGVGCRNLVVYGSGSLSVEEAHSMGRAAGGLVLPGRRGLRLARALVRGHDFSGRLWLDAIRYLRRSEDGAVPRSQQWSLIDEWLLVQQDLEVTELLTAPDQLVRDGEIDKLQRLLNDEAWPADARVVLPLDGPWLSNNPQALHKEIRRAGRPVAIALRASYDPINSLRRVRGLVKLADPSLNVMLLRSDPSAVGALAFGMRTAAVGVNTYTRHFPGPVRPRDENLAYPPRGTDVYIPALGAHHRAATLQMMEAAGSAQLNGLDICRCEHCSGQSLIRFAYTVDQLSGRAHDIAAMLQLAATMRQHPVSNWSAWWLARCNEALKAHLWLRRKRNVAVPDSKAIQAWVRFSATLGEGDRYQHTRLS
jgi:hypothetical protein